MGRILHQQVVCKETKASCYLLLTCGASWATRERVSIGPWRGRRGKAGMIPSPIPPFPPQMATFSSPPSCSSSPQHNRTSFEEELGPQYSASGAVKTPRELLKNTCAQGLTTPPAVLI